MLPQDKAVADMGPVERALDLLAKGCVGVAGTGLVVLVAIFGWLVWGRYVMNDTPTWVEQVALLLVVWITFLGGAAGVWTQSHLSIEFIREMLPSVLRVPLHWMALAGMLVFGIVLFWQGWTLAQKGFVPRSKSGWDRGFTYVTGQTGYALGEEPLFSAYMGGAAGLWAGVKKQCENSSIFFYIVSEFTHIIGKMQTFLKNLRIFSELKLFERKKFTALQ